MRGRHEPSIRRSALHGTVASPSTSAVPQRAVGLVGLDGNPSGVPGWCRPWLRRRRASAWPRMITARATPVGLQQARHELDLIGSDQLGGLLQVEVGLEPGVEHVTARLPPAGVFSSRVSASSRSRSTGSSMPVDDRQVGDVTPPEADPARLHSADLGLGRADRLAVLLPAQPLARAQGTQACPGLQARDGCPSILEPRDRRALPYPSNPQHSAPS